MIESDENDCAICILATLESNFVWNERGKTLPQKRFFTIQLRQLRSLTTVLINCIMIISKQLDSLRFLAAGLNFKFSQKLKLSPPPRNIARSPTHYFCFILVERRPIRHSFKPSNTVLIAFYIDVHVRRACKAFQKCCIHNSKLLVIMITCGFSDFTEKSFSSLYYWGSGKEWNCNTSHEIPPDEDYLEATYKVWPIAVSINSGS